MIGSVDSFANEYGAVMGIFVLWAAIVAIPTGFLCAVCWFLSDDGEAA